MPSKRPPKGAISYEKFWVRYGDEIYEQAPPQDAGPPTMSPDMLKTCLLQSDILELRALRFAAQANCPEAFTYFQKRFLREYCGIEAPPHTFVSYDRATPGRKESEFATAAWCTWLVEDRPSLTKDTLAKAIYAEDYEKADPVQRKQMIDRLRMAVKRYEARRKAREKGIGVR